MLIGLALPFGLAAAILATPIIVAAKPPPQPVDVAFSLPTSETGCGFQVDLAAAGKAAQIDLPGGRTLFTSPGLNVTVTNHATGASVTLNITGAGHVTTNADGSETVVATGRNLLWGGVEHALVLTRGRFTWTFFPNGTVSPQGGTGTKTDVCALIA
jgi:hypothetical protein